MNDVARTQITSQPFDLDALLDRVLEAEGQVAVLTEAIHAAGFVLVDGRLVAGGVPMNDEVRTPEWDVQRLRQIWATPRIADISREDSIYIAEYLERVGSFDIFVSRETP